MENWLVYCRFWPVRVNIPTKCGVSDCCNYSIHLSKKRQEEKKALKKRTKRNDNYDCIHLGCKSPSELSLSQGRIITTKSGIMSFSEDMSAFIQIRSILFKKGGQT